MCGTLHGVEEGRLEDDFGALFESGDSELLCCGERRFISRVCPLNRDDPAWVIGCRLPEIGKVLFEHTCFVSIAQTGGSLQHRVVILRHIDVSTEASIDLT
jgi:hypothetical protein